MSNDVMRREVNEARQAGKLALQSLYRAREKLGSARNWGLLDLFGGGFFTDLMKHSKIRDASVYVEEARKNLLIFQRELQDVDALVNLRVEINSFLSFADFFFDGLVADYLVQRGIADAREQVEDAISRVEYLLRQLENY